VPRSIEHIFFYWILDCKQQCWVLTDRSICCVPALDGERPKSTLQFSAAQTNWSCDSDAQTVTHPFLPCTGCHCKKPKYSSRTTSRSEQTSHTYVACTVMNLESWTQATMVSEARLLGFSIPFCFSVRWAWRRSNRRNILFRQSKKC